MDMELLDSKVEIADEEVITRVCKGESRLFEVLIRKYNPRLYRVGMSIIKNDSEIEDVMQNAYLKAFENLSKFEGRSSFGTWLTKIMINESLAFLKKSKRVTILESESVMTTNMKEMHDHSSPANVTMNRELGRALENSLLSLPEKYRLVFVLREMEGISMTETMETLGISDVNVRVRLNRAKAMLRESLSNYYKSDLVFNFHLTRCDRIVSNVLNRLGIA
jgi:RNA polymerase sigma-70 factor (ECF subfamily)